MVVLAGSGGNGGDALYAAAELAGDDEVAGVVAVAAGAHLHPGALEAARGAGVDVLDVSGVSEADLEGRGADSGDAAPGRRDALDDALGALDEADVVVDGLYGIGGRPGLTGVAARLVEGIGPEAYVVAVDLPSGADPSGLRVVGADQDAVFADETVTFGLPKPVHVLAGAPACGLLTVVDIGLSTDAAPVAESLGRDDVADLWPVPGPSDDKYARGVVGVVAGGENYTGAPVLAVTAAVCAGAGMVRYVGPQTPARIVRERVPEAVHGVGRVQAWVMGSGTDAAERDAAETAALRGILSGEVPVVVDAGALVRGEVFDLDLRDRFRIEAGPDIVLE